MSVKIGIGACGVVLLLIAGFFLLPARHVKITTHDAQSATTTQTLVGMATTTKPSSGGKSIVQNIIDFMLPHTILPANEAPFDAAAYDAKLNFLAHVSTSTVVALNASSSASSTPARKWPLNLWPVSSIYPNAGAILPMNRVVAYYGNLYSKQMGVLGQYPEDQMLAMLASTTAMWQAADPATPVIPALHYIVVTAQGTAQPDGKYRLRMPDSQIDKVLQMADKIHGLVFLDIQVGLSDVQTEVPLLEKYLKLPQVHLGIDPEFSMKHGERPGTVIGTMDASDVNFTAQYLAKLVRDNNLPPKMLIVHRFTEAMLTNYKNIKPLPEVQMIMDMDGFGSPSRKISTYRDVVQTEPVQFTGFKLFYHNDADPAIGGHLMAPEEVLRLTPSPSYIQYQ